MTEAQGLASINDMMTMLQPKRGFKPGNSVPEGHYRLMVAYEGREPQVVATGLYLQAGKHYRAVVAGDSVKWMQENR